MSWPWGYSIFPKLSLEQHVAAQYVCFSLAAREVATLAPGIGQHQVRWLRAGWQARGGNLREIAHLFESVVANLVALAWHDETNLVVGIHECVRCI